MKSTFVGTSIASLAASALLGAALLLGPGSNCAAASAATAECAEPEASRCPDVYPSTVFIWQHVAIGEFAQDLKFYAKVPQWKTNLGVPEFYQADYKPLNYGRRIDYQVAKASDGSLWTIDGSFTAYCHCTAGLPRLDGKYNSITGQAMLQRDSPEQELPNEYAEEDMCDDPEGGCDTGDGGGTGGGSGPIGYTETASDDASNYGGGPWKWVCEVTDWYESTTAGGPLEYVETVVNSCWLEPV